jgi:cryptochrome
MYGYNLSSFLLECLFDLDKNLQKVGGKLHFFLGSPVDVFHHLHAKYAVKKLCFEKDCEPIWHARDNAVKSNYKYAFIEKSFPIDSIVFSSGLCAKLKIDCVEQVANTLWNCREVIKANGGSAPLTREMFTVNL